jgi:hypothetical protein
MIKETGNTINEGKLPSAIVYLVSCNIFSDSLNFNAHGGFGTWAWAYHSGDLEEGLKPPKLIPTTFLIKSLDFIFGKDFTINSDIIQYTIKPKFCA